MDHGIRGNPLQFSRRYRYAREKMPYYAYHCKPIGPPLPMFVKKRLPRYGSQYIPLYGTKLISFRNIPLYRRGIWVTPYLPARVAGYQPRTIPVEFDVCPSKFSKPRTTRNPVRPYVEDFQHQIQSTAGYDGTTKGPHGPIHKGSLPCMIPERVPRMTKGPVLYSSRDLHPGLTQVPRVSRRPTFYASEDPLLCSSKEELSQRTKRPTQYPSKLTQGNRVRDSAPPMINDPPQPEAKLSSQPKAVKGSRVIATKVPRANFLTLSHSFIKRGAHSFLTKTSQAHFFKGSRASLVKPSRTSLVKGSQPSLAHTAIFPAPKNLSKTVKISNTGKKYCSAINWPF
ncbi:uncharacterized protein LOC117676271 [Pantherophis guttatus]|uniref:Uncharacterized protein LOC117676271 n=1 Tax=Pantherophis guttatus TaxID=94885 RepID=A0A6P9D792_PANGU|nr:uncharacterized protein LOC117676271 [Pantherophis guttatus]